MFQPALDRLGVAWPGQAAAVFYAGYGRALLAEVGFSVRDGTLMRDLPGMVLTLLTVCTACWMSAGAMGAEAAASHRDLPLTRPVRVSAVLLLASLALTGAFRLEFRMSTVELAFFVVAQYLQCCRTPPRRWSRLDAWPAS